MLLATALLLVARVLEAGVTAGKMNGCFGPFDITLVVGVLGVAAQGDFCKILSFHIVSQIGCIVLWLALMTPLALVGAMFYVIHHIVVKANLLLIAGVASRSAGSTEREKIGGLCASAPLLATLFVVPAFSPAGFASLSGFWAKTLIVKVALEVEGRGVAGAVLAVGLMTIFSMTTIWAAGSGVCTPKDRRRGFRASRPPSAGPRSGRLRRSRR